MTLELMNQAGKLALQVARPIIAPKIPDEPLLETALKKLQELRINGTDGRALDDINRELKPLGYKLGRDLESLENEIAIRAGLIDRYTGRPSILKIAAARVAQDYASRIDREIRAGSTVEEKQRQFNKGLLALLQNTLLQLIRFDVRPRPEMFGALMPCKTLYHQVFTEFATDRLDSFLPQSPEECRILQSHLRAIAEVFQF
jgi:hypothetical protein